MPRGKKKVVEEVNEVSAKPESVKEVKKTTIITGSWIKYMNPLNGCTMYKCSCCGQEYFNPIDSCVCGSKNK